MIEQGEKIQVDRQEIRDNRPDETAVSRSSGELLTQAASEYIEAHFNEKFSLKKMAGELYVNGCYLLRVFKNHTGYTPLAYHNHIRCERAGELLLHSDKKISDIGGAVGFASSAHFTHVFKKERGVTPTEYRAAGRAG